MLKRILVLFLLPVCTAELISCSYVQKNSTWKPNIYNADITSDSLFVEKVENMPDDFILGMDASSVPSLEKSGVVYSDCDGNEKDVYEILKENGINYIRVRVWNDPFDKNGNGYGGGNCDIENAVEVGRRASKYGMKLLVNFHYSDFWADPGKQKAPKLWTGLDINEKSDKLYRFTRECLERLLNEDVDIGMVQIGNETNGAMCGEYEWESIAKLMTAGARAVRQVCPNALAAVHFTNPEKAESFKLYAEKLAQYGVDYDVFASSYYPFWHGTTENLSNVLSDIAEKYGKKVMVAETSYAFSSSNTDFHNNTVTSSTVFDKKYPFTYQGQADYVRDLVNAVVNKTKNGIGVFYWEGTWISVGGASFEENSRLWEKYGSGWASSYASEYDPEDAGKWYGGCAVENQAFFDSRGKATEALKVFGLLKKGNLTANKET